AVARAARLPRRDAHRPHRRPRADARGRLRRARHAGGRAVSYARVVVAGLRFRVRELMVSRWFLLLCFLQPVIFATIAFYMFKAGGRPGTLLYAAIGAGWWAFGPSPLSGPAAPPHGTGGKGRLSCSSRRR